MVKVENDSNIFRSNIVIGSKYTTLDSTNFQLAFQIVVEDLIKEQPSM
jgi:hypothetical protein